MRTINPELSRLEPALAPLQKLGFAALLWFLFILHSRVLDMGLWWLHIPSMLLGFSIAVAAASRGLMHAFLNRTGAVLLILTAWMCFATAFSVWRGASVRSLGMWITSVLVYFVVAALIHTWAQFRKTYLVLAAAVLVLACLTLAFGVTQEGRLALGHGRFGNPNDLGQILLMSLPFWWFIATRPGAKARHRAFTWVAVVPIFITIVRTGSRGALIATIALMFVLLVRSSLRNKVQLSFAALAVIVFAGVTLPTSVKARYLTFFQAEQQSNMRPILEEPEEELHAAASAEARWELLRDSIILTAENPFFGVGPGVFDVAQDIYSQRVLGTKGRWQHTHNSYTEMSSENGLPALVLYLLLIVFAWRAATVRRPRGEPLSPRQQDVLAAAYVLRLSLFVFCLSALFGSFAYHTQLFVLAGLAMALRRVSRTEFSDSRLAVDAAAVPAPAAAPARSPALAPIGCRAIASMPAACGGDSAPGLRLTLAERLLRRLECTTAPAIARLRNPNLRAPQPVQALRAFLLSNRRRAVTAGVGTAPPELPLDPAMRPGKLARILRGRRQQPAETLRAFLLTTRRHIRFDRITARPRLRA